MHRCVPKGERRDQEKSAHHNEEGVAHAEAFSGKVATTATTSTTYVPFCGVETCETSCSFDFDEIDDFNSFCRKDRALFLSDMSARADPRRAIRLDVRRRDRRG